MGLGGVVGGSGVIVGCVGDDGFKCSGMFVVTAHCACGCGWVGDL